MPETADVAIPHSCAHRVRRALSASKRPHLFLHMRAVGFQGPLQIVPKCIGVVCCLFHLCQLHKLSLVLVACVECAYTGPGQSSAWKDLGATSELAPPTPWWLRHVGHVLTRQCASHASIRVHHILHRAARTGRQLGALRRLCLKCKAIKRRHKVGHVADAHGNEGNARR